MIQLRSILLSSVSNRFVKIFKAFVLAVLLLLMHSAIKAQNNCLSFDGLNDYVSVPSLGSGLTQFTFETWFNASALANSSGLNGIFNTSSWDTGDVHYQINSTKVQLAVNGSTIIDVSYPFVTNTWYHLATTYNSSTKKIKLYVNGFLVQSVTLATAVAANFTAAKIGSYANQRYFSGMFDEYRIWNYERTAANIHDNMFASMVGNETGLLVNYNFNQGTAGGTNTGITSLISSTGSNNGTLTNFALTGSTSNWITSSTPTALANNCLNFNGSNNSVTCGILNPTKFTIEAWVYPNSVTVDQAIISTLTTGSGTGCELHIGSDGYAYITVRNGSNFTDIKSTSKMLANNWVHLAATFDGSTCALYVNGVKVITQSSISYNAGSSTMLLGQRSSGLYNFSGNIDDVRIFNRVLTESNLHDSIQVKLSGIEKGLLACYSFDQGVAGGTNSGLATLISSTGTYHGTLNNFLLTGSTSNWVSGIKPAPANHVTNFAGSLVSNKMTLTWIDAVGETTPDGYYIYASKTNSFTDPVDGVQSAIDNDLSDGIGVVKVVQGVKSCNSFVNEIPQTTYYFRIVPFSNPNNFIKFLTSGNVPQTNIISKPLFSEVASTLPYPGSWVDYDNDGYLDLLVPLDENENTVLYRNNHNNTYSPITSFNSSSFEWNNGWIDYDGNGFLDFLGASTIYLNNNGASFTPVASSIVGLNGLSGDWGDYDRDGDLDFLTVASNGFDIKLFRRDPTYFNELFGNSFRPCRGSIKWIDYNNDGYLDIIAIGLNPLDNKLYSTIYKNEGKGRFTEQTQIVLPKLDNTSISFGDYNSDGRMDILLKGKKDDGINSLLLCKNVNGNNFSVITIANYNDSYRNQAFFADFDNDGLADILVSTKNSDSESTIKVFRNNGDETFSELFSQNFTGSEMDAGLADINNDGNLDFVAGSTLRVFQNTTTSTNLKPNKITTASAALEGNGVRFQWSATDDKTTSNGLTYNLRVGTSAGASNIVSAWANSAGILKLLKQGNMGENTTHFLQLPKGTYYWNVQAIDNSFKGGSFMDADLSFTIADVASSKLQANRIDDHSLQLKWTSGNGNKRVVFCKIGTSGTASPLNNKSYIASTSYGEGDQIGTSGWYCVYNGVSDNTIVQNLSSANSYIFHVIEYFGSTGAESYIVSTADGNPGYFSTGIFSEQPTINFSSQDNSYAFFGDYNNDNFLDFLILDEYAQTVSLNINNKNNSFTQNSVSIPDPLGLANMLPVDYNNDGWLDFIISGQRWISWGNYPTKTRLYNNNGNNTFTENTGVAIDGTLNTSLAWGDYNNDGNIDLFIGGSKSIYVPPSGGSLYPTTSYEYISKIYKNNGTANGFSFTEQSDIVLPGLTNGAAKWGDFNNDGWPDLLMTGLANDGSYYLYLYLNNKNNSFTGQTLLKFSGATNSFIECADFDKDGFLDFILATGDVSGNANNFAILFRNNGDNTFTQDANTFSNQKNWNYFALGDYNNDNAIDVVFSDANISFKRLYANNYPEKSFTVVPNFIFPETVGGTVGFGDYDNDGDQDILSTNIGSDKEYKMIRNSLIMNSGSFLVNTAPSAPTNIRTTLKPGQLLVEWDKVTSDVTPNLSYNVMLTCIKPNIFLLNSPNSDTLSGRRVVPVLGNSGLNNFTIFKNLLPGTYKIKVQSIDGTFKWSEWSSPLTVEVKDVQAFFTFDEVCRGSETQFADQSIPQGNLTWLWKFDDGTTSTLQSPKHDFVASGTHQVWLVVTSTELKDVNGKFLKDSVLHTIYVKPNPKASYTAPNVCQGDETVFTNNTNMDGATAKTWKWDYGNGETSTNETPLNKTYGIAKTYPTQLIVVATNECSDTAKVSTTVTPVPSAFILSSVNSKFEFCKNSTDSAFLYVPTQPNCSYKWLSNGTGIEGKTDTCLLIKGTDIAKVYSIQAFVSVDNSYGGCSAITPTPVEVRVKESPTAPTISQPSNTTICEGDRVALSVAPLPGLSYLWSGGLNSNTSNIYDATTSGVYSLTITNGSNCSVESLNKIAVTVNKNPDKPQLINSLGATASVCSNRELVLSTDNDQNLVYQWYDENVGIQGAISSQYKVERTGKYSLEVKNASGCKSVSSVSQIVVNPSPITPVIISDGLRTFCASDSTLLEVNAINGLTYLWLQNGGETNITGNKLYAKQSGQYNLKVKNDFQCEAISNPVQITVNPLPQLPSLTYGETSICQGSSVAFAVPNNADYTYQWMNGNAIIPSSSSNMFSTVESGNYWLRITNSSLCSVSTKPVSVIVSPNPQKPEIVTLSNTLFCPGTEVELSVKDPVSKYGYQWKRSGIPIDGATSSSYKGKLTAGDYRVEVLSGNCSAESEIITLNTKAAPAKPNIYAWGPNVWIISCDNSTASDYRWYYNDQLVVGAKSSQYVAKQNLGNYYVEINEGGECYTMSDIINIPTGNIVNGVDDFSENSLSVFPNPTKGKVWIALNGILADELSVELFDALGNLLESHLLRDSNGFSIDLSNYSKGIYLCKIGYKDTFVVKKIVKE